LPPFLNNRDEVLILHAIAKEYGQRPSDIIRGEWWAYQFDVGVATVANTDPKKQTKQQATAPLTKEGVVDGVELSRWGAIPSKAIPEDGIW
jgi:hypothetical protein